MKKVWRSEEIKKIYREDSRLHGEKIDFTPWARLVYEDAQNRFFRPLQIDTADSRNHREIVTSILFAILVRRIKWDSILTYYYPIVSVWLSFVKKSPYPVFLEHLTQEITDSFLNEARTSTQRKLRSGFLVQMHTYMTVFLTDKSIMDRDVWPIDFFSLSPNRYQISMSTRTISFDCIENDRNRWLLKKYIADEFMYSDRSLSTITSRLNMMKFFFRWWGNRPIDIFSQKDLEEYAAYIEKNQQISYYNALIHALHGFWSKGIQDGLWSAQPILYDAVIKKFKYRIRNKEISPKVIKELFSRLDKMPLLISTLFLLVYYTGIRISEAVNIRVDCMYRLADTDTKYIKVYQLKMRKYTATPIPQHLYEILQRQRIDVLRKNPDEQYLFPSKSGEPIRRQYLGQYLNRFCRRENICDEDGKIYRFHAHEFRHGYAMRLIRHDVPFLTVQKLLHHDSPEMTLVYAQIDEQTRKKRYLSFCKKNEFIRDRMTPEERKIDDDMIWLHHQISQILPNGFCGYPIQLGECPHANACLFCDQFYTTPDFLPVLEYQLAQIHQLQKHYGNDEKNLGMIRTEARLKELIHCIKGGEQIAFTK